MSLRDKQSHFVFLLSKLVAWVYAQGWALTLGEGYRSDSSGHMPGSLHYIKLAQDLNLFVNGNWMASDCPEWRATGKYWKSLDPLCAWGGDFQTGDFNHFSLKHGERS